MFWTPVATVAAWAATAIYIRLLPDAHFFRPGLMKKI